MEKSIKDILEDDVDQKYYLNPDRVKRLILNIQQRSKEDIYVIGNINNKNYVNSRVYSYNNVSPSIMAQDGTNKYIKILCKVCKKENGKFIPTDRAYIKENHNGIFNCVISREYKGICNGTNVVINLLQDTKKGHIELDSGNVADMTFPGSKTRRGRVIEHGNISPTIRTNSNVCRIFSDGKYISIRRLTPLECFRLMGFSDIDFYKAEKVNSDTQLYKQVGNSIVVDVLYYIFVELYKAMPYLFENLRLCSLFSGIGAFESALDRLYEDINGDISGDISVSTMLKNQHECDSYILKYVRNEYGKSIRKNTSVVKSMKK